MSLLNTSDLHRIFKSLDQNDDGLLSLGELNWLLERIGVYATSDELAALVGKDGLTFDEFSNFYETVMRKNYTKSSGNQNGNVEAYDQRGDKVDEGKEEEEDSDLYQAFKVFDLNGDGLISSQELQSVLWKLGMWERNGGLDCDRIMHQYDVNGDGFVDFDEFKTMMLAH